MFRSKTLRPIAGVVLITFTALTLQPLTAAAQLPSAPKRAQSSSESGEERFSRTLNEIHEILKEVVPQAAMPHKAGPTAPAAAGKPGEKVLQAVGPKMRLESERAKPLPGIDVTAKVKTLRGKYKELKSLEAEVTKGFRETEKHIRDKNLPAEILARQEAAVAEYDKRKAEFNALMQAVESAADGKGELQPALANLGDFMAKYPNSKTHTPTDPNNLPWGSPKPVTRAPYTSPAQFKTSRLFGETVKVAQAGSLSGIGLPSTVLPTTPMPADTAPTEDVQITQAIRDLATSLGNNPVKIYNWVRNNIQFIPSYGSIQGSDLTLQTKRGNAFDTASLLIALLRAANIPSRYVYGTIEVPVDKAMNWVGGVTAPNAVLNLLGQGGIPARGVGSAGQMQSIQLEHVWVEAFVDYNPSRGAVNRSPNTWVPMDASFKQYAHTAGMDLASNVPFDAQGTLAQFTSATINQTEGWVQNVDPSLVNSTLATYQNKVSTHISAKNPNATVGDVLGTTSIVLQNNSILFGTLPYKVRATGAKFIAMPATLQWRYRTNLTDATGLTEYFSINRSTASLAGKKITISFVPAKQADSDLINSFMPTAHADGTPIQPSEIPSSLPGYLLQLTAEIRIDGQLAGQSSASTTMGQTLAQATAIFNPAHQVWEEGGPNQPVVGDYHAIALDLQGVGAAQLTALGARIGATKARLDQFRRNPADTSPLLGLTKEDLSGDLLYSGILNYFASVDRAGDLAARTLGNIVNYRLPSYGAFVATAQPLYFFGVVRRVTFPGASMDVDRLAYQAEASDDDPAKRIGYMRQIGTAGSLFESAVPEKLLVDTTTCNVPGSSNPDPGKPTCPEGVSAAKAINIAAAQGQRIYTLSQAIQDDPEAILSQLSISADAKADIASALAAGKQVTTHQADITINGWTGSGYIVYDPDTGAGAYKIAGGANGGFLDYASIGSLYKLLSVAAFLTTLLFAVPLGLLFATFFILAFALDLASTILDCIHKTDQIGPMTILLATVLAVFPARFEGVFEGLIKRYLEITWVLPSSVIGSAVPCEL